MTVRPLRRRVALLRPLALVLPSLTALSVLAVPPASAADPASTPAPTPSAAPALTPVSATEAGTAGARGDYEAGRYIVTLRAEPAAARTTAGRRFAARSTATRSYVADLRDTQRAVASSVGATRLASYTLTTNGFAADLTAKQAARLAVDPRVSAVVENEILHVADASTSTGYLGIEGDGGAWESVGGPANAGKGIVVGVVDTGIAPENPSFAGEPLGAQDGAAPYRAGDGTIVFHKSDGTDFHGVCTTGEQFTAADCTTKIIGARYYLDGFGADNIGDASTGEYVSPRDGEDHGSHTASTAAGDADIATGSAHISGVTPAAKIAVYKACWSGPDPVSQADDGCATADLLAAIDAAVGDGVDVINYSIGGGSAQTTNSVTDQAFMRAAEAGVFVAAAGGNAGPDASTLDNASPWITTVAASTIPASEGTVVLGDGSKLLGATVTVPDGGVAGPLVAAADVAAAGASAPELCGPGSLDPTEVAGTIVLCDRGEIDRVAKSAEVHRAGGIGMVMVNPTPSSTDLDAHSVPTVHLDAGFYDQLHAYAEQADATATLLPGNETGHGSVPTPQVAGFSSRGPVEADGSDLIKPDVAAPGVNILAATANAEGDAPTWGYMSGTSMASPHVAGLGALYLGAHPTATPAEVKSALMTTATDTVDADGDPAEEPFAQGNGQVVPRRYLDPGLLYLNDVDDWKGYLAGIGEGTSDHPIDGSDLNLASIGVGSLAGTQTVTRTVTATEAGTWTSSVAGMDGVDVTVEPSGLTFDEAGDTATFTVTFDRDGAPLGDFTTGYLTWTSGQQEARSSLAVRPVAFDAPAEVAGAGTAGSVDVVPHVGDDAQVDLVAEGLARGSRVDDTGTVGTSQRYAVTVPDGSTFARFSLDSADDTADLDLLVYRRTPSGNLSLAGKSATGSADEQVDLRGPDSGTYVVEVVAYAAGSGGGTRLDYGLTSYVVDPAQPLGGFTVTPSTIDGHVGDTPTIGVSWSDLEAGSYLGLVRFGDTGISTIVTVDAGAEAPAQPGTPTLSVDPDASGWVGRGQDLRVTATGLTPGAAYDVSFGNGAPVRSGKASLRGTLDWAVPITDAIPVGPTTVHLHGADADLSADVRVTPIRLVSAWGFPMTAFNGVPFSRLDITYSGHGDLRYEIAGADSGTVYLDRTEHVGEVVGLPTWSISTPYAKVGDEGLVGTVTVLMPDGSEGPSYTTDVFEPDHVEPGSITFTPTSEDPSIVDVQVVNNSFSSYTPMVRYRGCDGRYVVANGFLKEDGTTTQQWDLTGLMQVEVVDSFGQVLAGYRNRSAGRCDSAHVHISQDYWGTVTATPASDPGYDPARPLTLEVSNRYAPGSPGFDLLVGEGDELYAGDPLYYEQIPVEEVDERGPVVSRRIALREGVASWTSSNWEAYIDPPGIIVLATAWLNIPGLTVADLAPHDGTPGDPGDPGDPEPPVITPGTPTLTGSAVVGRTLTASPGSWAPAGVGLSYQWLRDNAPITGADGATYTLRRADAGHHVSVIVTGTLEGADPVSATSAQVPVTGRFTATPKPRLVGTPKVGHTLRVVTGTWRPQPVDLELRWYRDGKRITVADGSRYQLRKADRGHRITVVVTGHAAGYADVSRSSGPRRVR